MKIIETKIIEIIERTPDIKSFRCMRTENIDFSAGQFMNVVLNNNGKEINKIISISSSPTETEYFEFTKKITGSEFSNLLNNMKVNDHIKLKLPFGSFILNPEHKKICFLSGGIGITPLRCMAKYMIDKKLDIDVILIYGNRTIKDIAFKSEFDEYNKNHNNFKVVYTLDSAETENWQGYTGLITSEMIKKEIADYKKRYYYICGPDIMVNSLSNLLTSELMIDKNHINFENFKGY